MCITQFIQAHQVEIILSLITGLVTGFVTGVITSYLVTHYFRVKEQRIFIVEIAGDLAQECHTLLGLTNRLIDQIALRKYHAYEIIHVLKNLSGEEKRRTRNKMVMEFGLGEVQKATLELLCVSIHKKQLEKRLQSKHGAVLDYIIKPMNAAIDAADALCLKFSSVIDFHTYVSNVEHMHKMAFEDFIEQLEEEECEADEKISAGRDKLNRALLEFIAAIAEAH